MATREELRKQVARMRSDLDRETELRRLRDRVAELEAGGGGGKRGKPPSGETVTHDDLATAAGRQALLDGATYLTPEDNE